MPSNYSVDDILEEIKRKKSGRDSAAITRTGQDPRSQDPRSQDPRGLDPRSSPPTERRTVLPPQTTRAGDVRPSDIRPGDPRPGDTRPGDPRPSDIRPSPPTHRDNFPPRDDFPSQGDPAWQGDPLRQGTPAQGAPTQGTIAPGADTRPPRRVTRQPVDYGLRDPEPQPQQPRRTQTPAPSSRWAVQVPEDEQLGYRWEEEPTPARRPLEEAEDYLPTPKSREEERAPATTPARESGWEQTLPPPQLFNRSQSKHSILQGLEERTAQEEEPFDEGFQRARESRRTTGVPQEPQGERTQLHPIVGREGLRLPEDGGEAPHSILLPEEDRGATRAIRLPEEPLEGEDYPLPEEEPRSRFSFGRDKAARKKGKKAQKAANWEPEPILNDLEDENSPDVDDYNTPEDADRVMKDITVTRRGLVFRLIVSILSFGALTYFAFALHNVQLPLLAFMAPEVDMRMFMGVNLGILLLLTLVCNTTIGGGLVSLFTLRPDSDTPIALAVVASVAQGVVLVVNPTAVMGEGVHFYFAVVALGLLFNTIGKLFMIRRIEGNFKILSGSSFEKHAVMTVKNRELARELTRGQNLDEPVVAYSTRAGFLTNFIELSYTEDYGENLSRITTPLFLFFSLLAGGGCYFITRDIFVALTALTAMLAVCAPFTTTIVGNLPLWRMAGKLSRHGSMVAGYTALDHFDDVNGFVMEETELFPKGAIILHGIKAFDQKRVDEAILDAASVICKSGGALRDIFIQMIGGKETLLKEVDTLVYEDGMGLSAWVSGKRVLIGNRELMRHHSVDVPSRDYEQKFVRDGREILYLSNSGELTAMFILSYTANSDIADELTGLADRGIVLIVNTSDPNITPRKIGEVFHFPGDMVNIIPAKLQEEYQAMSTPRPRAKAEMVYTGSVLSKTYAMKSVLTAKGAIVLGTILQMLGMVLGYALVAFFAFTGAMSALQFTLLLLYQLLWTTLVMLLPNLRRFG